MGEATSIQKVYWKDVRKTVARINPEFCAIVDKIDPPFPLFKARFPFGAEFIKKGKLYLPTKHGHLVPLIDQQISKEIQNELGYNIGTNPVSMLLENTAELFLNVEGLMTPFSFGIITPGKIISTSRILSPNMSHQPAFLWNITAGARNIFMLPKIADKVGYRKLRREFHIQVEPPQGLHEHWEIFREIANHENFGDEWHMEILFFSKEWFLHFKDDAWVYFHRYLLQSGWDTTEFWRNRFIWDLVFSVTHQMRGSKPNPYIVDTVKHILATAVGAVPGFSPAIDDGCGPIRRLQYIFMNFYKQLDQYFPIILQPKVFTLYTPCPPVYYALQFPTTFEFSPKSRKNSSTLSDLYDTKSLIEKDLYSIASGLLNVEHTPLADIPRLVNFGYFHSDEGTYRGIRSSKNIPLEDPLFTVLSMDNFEKSLHFPTNSTFARGCIRIKHSDDKE